jgi:glycosyltransferase involved in cell wall biosynthesis
LLFPAEEDFGIVPLEAQACGAPVIAFGKGGALETIQPLGDSPRPTGVFFFEQQVDAVVSALEEFERHRDRFDPADARANALPFRTARFEQELFDTLGRISGL